MKISLNITVNFFIFLLKRFTKFRQFCFHFEAQTRELNGVKSCGVLLMDTNGDEDDCRDFSDCKLLNESVKLMECCRKMSRCQHFGNYITKFTRFSLKLRLYKIP